MIDGGRTARVAPGWALLPALTLASGCAPALLWYGHDPQRAHRLEVRSDHGQAWVVQSPSDGSGATQRSAPFDELTVSELIWSNEGHHFAVPVRRGQRWSVLADFKQDTTWWAGVAALMWSDDGAHLAYAGEDGGRWRVVHDQHLDPPFTALIDGTLVLGRGGARWGYGAIDGACARVVIDGQAGPCHAGVRALALGDTSSDDIALVVDHGTAAVMRGNQTHALPGLLAFAPDVRGRRWTAALHVGSETVVLLDGDVVDRADELRDLAFTPGGALTYLAHRKTGWFFVGSAASEGPYAGLRRPVFSAAGDHHGYVAVDAAGMTAVVVDGVRLGTWPDADGLVFSGDGKRVAFVVRQGTGAAVVCENRVHAFDLIIETSLVFSADSAHWAALVGDRTRRRLSIVIDGKRHHPFDSEELFGAQTPGIADPARLRSWVLAELERDLRGGQP